MCAAAPILREGSVNFVVLHISQSRRVGRRLPVPPAHQFAGMCLVLGLLGAASSAWAITTAPSWEPRELVANGFVSLEDHAGADHVLAYDHHGNPGIVYSDTSVPALRYARRAPGVGWVHADVDTTAYDGSFPSLAYDRYERPAISYFDSDNPDQDLRYAHFDGAAWQLENVDSAVDVGQYTSLAFDLLGRPAIAYRDITNTSLKYVADTDGDLSLADETPVTVVNDFDEGNYASLVFDPLNRPMVAHYDSTNLNLRFSVAEPGIGWVTTTVDADLGTGFFPSIDIDPDTGYPAIAYYDGVDQELRYADWDGDMWNLTTIDSDGNVGQYPSLAFDPADGNPAISYTDIDGGNLKIAWHDGSMWQTQTVDAVGDVGLGTSLAFNDFGTGFPSIAYLDSGQSLYFIEDPPAAVPEPSSLALLTLGVFVVSIRRTTKEAPMTKHQ
jgi:PEP-CTERM motif